MTRVLKSCLLLTGSLGLLNCSDLQEWRSTDIRAEATPAALVPAERKPTSRLSPADSAIAAGETHYWDGDYDAARSVWLDALRRVSALGDSLAEPRLLTWLGLAAWRQGDYAEARRLGEQALALKLQRGLRAEMSRSYNALGLLAWNEGRLGDAAALFRDATRTAQAEGDEEGVGKAGGNLGLVHTDLGEFREARAGFLAARGAGRALRDARIEGNALTNLGMLEIRIGDAPAAVRPLQEARRLYRSIEYGTGEQNALGQLATAYAALGRPQDAFAVLDSALALAREQGLRQEEASNLQILAELYQGAGDPQRALRFFQQSQVLNSELGLQVEAGTIRRSEAAIHAALGNTAQARSHALEALEMHRQAGAQYEELQDLLLLAEITAEPGYMEMARRLVRQLNAPAARIALALAEARIADRVTAPRRVIQALDAAQPDLTRAGFGTEWEAHALRSRALARLGLLDSAVVVGRRAIDAVERVRSGYGSGALRTTYTADKARVYSDLVLLLLRLGRTEEAFGVADAARGRALVEHLSGARASGGPRGDALRTLEASNQLLRRVDALVARLNEAERVPPQERGAALASSTGDLARKLAEARSEYEALFLRTVRQYRGSAALLGATTASTTAIRAALAPDEGLLKYLITANRVLIFVITRDTVHTLDSGISADELAGRVRLASDLYAKQGMGTQQSAAVSAGLYRVLFEPVIRSGALGPRQRLIIVPHGSLSYLPFAALREPSTGRFVAENFVLSYLPSAAALVPMRGEAYHRGPRFWGRRNAAIFAPLPEQLPASRREATMLRRSMWLGKSYLGSRATESSLREALAQPRIVHVATHGIMNSTNPMFSRIQMARAAGNGPAADGRFDVHEVLGTVIRSPLVFLSGCETGLGLAGSSPFTPGEDYATLAQSFLFAGAKGVVATLWRVDDDGAAAFATGFYQHLRSRTPRDALAEAQREMARHPRYNHPYYWAGYVLSGDGWIVRTRQELR